MEFLIYIGFILFSLLLSLTSSIIYYIKLTSFSGSLWVGIGQTFTALAMFSIWWTNTETSFISQRIGIVLYLISVLMVIIINYITLYTLKMKQN